jgi:hypothetical protein
MRGFLDWSHKMNIKKIAFVFVLTMIFSMSVFQVDAAEGQEHDPEQMVQKAVSGFHELDIDAQKQVLTALFEYVVTNESEEENTGPIAQKKKSAWCEVWGIGHLLEVFGGCKEENGGGVKNYCLRDDHEKCKHGGALDKVRCCKDGKTCKNGECVQKEQ